jgi:D-glycero-D-manno-heptose 1,7-bisphosphate phosphatase
MSDAAVFLDRDGTLIEDVGYLDDPRRVAFYPWSVDAVRALNRAGLRVVLTTNQSGIARGYLSEATLRDVHAHVASVLAAGGARIDAYYYCPHHPDGTVEGYGVRCDCRKPATGMIDRAIRELGVDPRRSVVVGDKWLDIGMARNAGARGVLVRTGYGASQALAPPAGLEADWVADNLVGAVSWILGKLRG